MILYTIFFSILYWIGAACFGVFILHEGDFLTQLIRPDMNTISIRLSTLFVLILFSIFFNLINAKNKRMEKELNKKHSLVPSALDKISSLIIVFDFSGRIVRFNRTCEQITGYSFSEVKNKYFWKLFLDEKSAQEVRENLTNLDIVEFPKEQEALWLVKGGRQKLIKWVNTTIFDDKTLAKYVVGVGMDISRHQHLEESLRKEGESYKNLADIINLGISFVSPDGLEIFYINNQMKKWFPQDRFLKKSICHSIFSNFSQNVCFSCPTCKALEKKEHQQATMKASADGKDFVYRVDSFPVVDKNGKVTSIIESVEDITKAQEQEAKIRRNYLNQAVMNSLLRFSLENISLEGFLRCALSVILSIPAFSSESMGAIFLVENDPKTLTLKAQSKFPQSLQDHYGKVPFGKYACGRAASLGELQFVDGRKSYEEIKETGIKVYGRYCMPILYAGNVLGVIDICLKKGHIPVKEEQELLDAISNTLSGVIQRKRAEMNLSQINKCFVNLTVDPIDNIQQLVTLCGNILGAASAFYNRMDFENDSFYSVAEYNVPPNYITVFESSGSICCDVIKEGKGEPFVMYNLGESSYVKTDPFCLHYKFQTYIGQAVECHGDYTGVLCVVYKTDLLLTEEDKKTLSIIVSAIAIEEERTKERQELQQAYTKLEKIQSNLVQSEKLAALGRFSSGIAHEVKNPLGIILGGMEFLERKLQPIDKTVEMAIKKIKESTLRADSIVRNLLKFAMPSEIKIEKVRPKDLVNDTLSLLKYRIPLRNIDIIAEFSKENIYVEIDKNQVEQVLFNLLMNATEAMPKGGHIKVKTYKGAFEKFTKEKPACVIEIIDTGEGISREDLPKLFEPFFTTKRDKKGTGLGLSMSRMITENHKGLLIIESELGEGTSAKVILPSA